jgi:hypothetical protein
MFEAVVESDGERDRSQRTTIDPAQQGIPRLRLADRQHTNIYVELLEGTTIQQ